MTQEIYFAPLQGLTDSAYRIAHAEYAGGITRYCSPFLRLEHKEIRRRDLRDISHSEESESLLPQVIVSGEDELSILSDAVMEKGYRSIDINMGCPFPMQTQKGRGTGLMERPEKVSEIMECVKRLTGKDGVSFSVKMRLGHTDPGQWREILPILNAAPLSHITMHPRIGKQQYKGDLFMDEFKAFLEECTHPVIYNGDITSVSDIMSIQEQFPGLKGIMIGRGLLSRPTLAHEAITGSVASEEKIRECILCIHERVLQDYENTLEGGDGQILQKIQPFWEYPGEYFDKKFIKHLTKTRSLDAYKKIILSES